MWTTKVVSNNTVKTNGAEANDPYTYNAAGSDGHVTQRVPAIVSKAWRLHGTHLQSNFDPNKHHLSTVCIHRTR